MGANAALTMADWATLTLYPLRPTAGRERSHPMKQVKSGPPLLRLPQPLQLVASYVNETNSLANSTFVTYLSCVSGRYVLRQPLASLPRPLRPNLEVIRL